MRVTVDTSILVRMNVKASGPARELLRFFEAKETILVLSSFLLDEVARVLTYPRVSAIYRLSDEEVAQHVELLRSVSMMVTPVEGPPVVLADPNDDPVIYTAFAGDADVLCTIDRHFYEPNVLSFCSRYGIQVVDDVELLYMLRSAG